MARQFHLIPPAADEVAEFAPLVVRVEGKHCRDGYASRQNRAQ